SGFDPERDRAELRLLAIKCLEAGAPWVALGAGGPDPVVIAARAKQGTRDLKPLLPGLLERAGGKGGGGSDFLQISAADATHAEAAWRWVAAALDESGPST